MCKKCVLFVKKDIFRQKVTVKNANLIIVNFFQMKKKIQRTLFYLYERERCVSSWIFKSKHRKKNRKYFVLSVLFHIYKLGRRRMKKHLNSVKSFSKLFITYESIIVNKYVQGMSEMKKKCEHFCS